MTTPADLKAMPTSGLLDLMDSISNELRARGGKSLERVPRPPSLDADFCLMILYRLRGDQEISVSEQQKVDEIAREYPEWVKQQGLPSDASPESWALAREVARSFKAHER